MYHIENWCLWNERYLLYKLKRTDHRDNAVIANSTMYRGNRELIIYKYCRNKFREAREERRLREEKKKQREMEKLRQHRAEERKATTGSVKTGAKITDFFQQHGKSPQKTKMKCRWLM